MVEQNRALEKQNGELLDQNRQLLEQIENLRGTLATGTANAPDPKQTNEPATSSPVVAKQQVDEDDADSGVPVSPAREQQKTFGTYTPGLGFTVANTENGSANISVLGYVRYLNQLGLNPTYTNAFGTVSNIQKRQDFQLQKVLIKFHGWLFSPNLRYFFYVWTANANMGQGAQVVVAGNLNYVFNRHFTFSGGVNGLPGTRSVEGNFPYWLTEDYRPIADEFFRPSYTTGIWARAKSQIASGITPCWVTTQSVRHQRRTTSKCFQHLLGCDHLDAEHG